MSRATRFVVVLTILVTAAACTGGERAEQKPAEGATVVAKIDTGQPVGLAAGFGSVWVADHREETISRIDPHSNRVVRRVLLGVFPSDLAAGAGAVWVPVLEGFRLARVDPGTHEETASFPGVYLVAATGFGSVWALYFEGGTRDWGGHWRGHTVVRIDPHTNRIAARIRMRRVVGHGIAAGEGAVWVSVEPDRVARIDPRRNRVVALIRVPGRPNGVAVGEGAVWIGLANGRVARIDPRRNRVVTTIRTGTHVEYLDAGLGGVWVGNVNDIANSTLSKIDPRTNKVAWTIPICDGPQGVRVAFGDVWVACFEDAQVWRVRP